MNQLSILSAFVCVLLYLNDVTCQNGGLSCSQINCNQGQMCVRLPNNRFGCAAIVADSKSIPASYLNVPRNENVKNRPTNNQNIDNKRTSNNNIPSFTMDPCLSSPCPAKKICRVISNTQTYVCIDEIDYLTSIPVSENFHLNQEKNKLVNNLNKALFDNSQKSVAPGTQMDHVVLPSRASFRTLGAKDNRPLSTWGILQERAQNEKISTLAKPININKINDTTVHYCDNHHEGDRIPHPTDQHKFISCHEQGNYIIMECPEALFFNQHLDRCDYHQDPMKSGCESNPCHYGNECVELPEKKYQCNCKTGFSGPNCEIAPDFCASNPCGSNGQCIVFPPESPLPFYCKCFNGASFGLSCADEIEKTPCNEETTDTLFSTKIGNSLFVHCDHDLEYHLKFCNAPLLFSEENQECEWVDQASRNIKKNSSRLSDI